MPLEKIEIQVNTDSRASHNNNTTLQQIMRNPIRRVLSRASARRTLSFNRDAALSAVQPPQRRDAALHIWEVHQEVRELFDPFEQKRRQLRPCLDGEVEHTPLLSRLHDIRAAGYARSGARHVMTVPRHCASWPAEGLKDLVSKEHLITKVGKRRDDLRLAQGRLRAHTVEDQLVGDVAEVEP